MLHLLLVVYDHDGIWSVRLVAELAHAGLQESGTWRMTRNETCTFTDSSIGLLGHPQEAIKKDRGAPAAV